MSESRFIFSLTPYDTETLLPQVRRALEKRTELLSRKQYPALWALTDRFRARSRNGSCRNPLRTRVLSVVCLVLGLVLLIPGLMDPGELLVPLLAGAVGVCAGVNGLWRAGAKPKDLFDVSARKLLSGAENIPAGQITVTFTTEGIEITDPEKTVSFVSYNEVETVVQTADAVLVVYGERVMLLQKRDLAEGEETDLFQLLRQKTDGHVLGDA